MKAQLCQQCGEQPTTYRDDRGGRIRFGRRANHDLCRRCWRAALAAARARSGSLFLLALLLLALAAPARAQNVAPPDFCPQAAALVRYFADARDHDELETSALLHVDSLPYDARGIAMVRLAVTELYAHPQPTGEAAAARFLRGCKPTAP
jgi:hypothetical protein